jgi:hypothetical protein
LYNIVKDEDYEDYDNTDDDGNNNEGKCVAFLDFNMAV